MATGPNPTPSFLSARTVVLFLLLVLLIWIAGGIIPLWLYNFDTNKAGQFADTFGAVNAFFTGLAFFGVLLTIVLQRHELALQREELELTRNELKGSKEAQEQQATILAQTAKLNALTALTTHAAKSYEHAVTLEMDEPIRRERAKEYDSYIVRLKVFVEDLAIQSPGGFGFLSMEEQRVQRPVLKVSVDHLGSQSSSPSSEGRRTSFRLRLIVTNLTADNITLQSVEAYLKARSGEKVTIRFSDSHNRAVPPRQGTAVIQGTTQDLLAEQTDLPILGVVVIRVAQRPEPLRYVIDKDVAAEFQEGQSA